MESHTYRIMHKPSSSVAVLTFEWKDEQVKISSLHFIVGNVLDLSSYRKYKKHAETKFIKAVNIEASLVRK
jgi:hypothetical protein